MGEEQAIEILERMVHDNCYIAADKFSEVGKTILDCRKADKEKIKELQEKMDYMMEVHRKECDEMKHYVDKTAREAEIESDKKMYKIMEEQERRYHELKQHGREMIKAFAKYI